MQVTFWLLDLNCEISNDDTEVWLWGISRSGERVLIVDRSFVGYFYAAIADGADSAKVVEEIERQRYSSVVKLEVVERRIFGKPINAVKVYCKDPDVMSKHAKAVRELEGVADCFEDDVRLSMRYLIDSNVVPCGWHEAEVVEDTNKIEAQVDRVYIAESTPKPLDIAAVPQLRVMGLSTIRYSREGSPKPDKDPVVLVSVATNQGEQRQFVADEKKDDESLLKAFVDYVRTVNPDVIVGYGVNGEDWPYLKERRKRRGVRLNVDRTETEPHTSTYGHMSVTGRANVDLLDYADEFPEVKVKTLENLADYLGVMKIGDRTAIEEIDYADYWDSREMREQLKSYSVDNTRCIMGLAEAILDFAMQLSNLVSIPLDHAGTAAAGFRVEWFIIKNTHTLGELVPRRTEQAYRPYAGGVVLQPKPGLHENVAVLDFKSMYPNIMITYNLSPDSYVSRDMPEPKGGSHVAPEVGHRFRKQPDGFYKKILSNLLKVRADIRSKMRRLPPKSMEYRVLDARQKAVKVITNAAYGYAGWTGARWYAKPVAEAAAAWGRHTIQAALGMAENKGLTVVYGDTDSIFVKYEKEKVEQLSKEIQTELGLEVELDKLYERVFFSEAKKRYAGLLPEGRLDIVGLEVMRGDWAAVAKKVQEGVLEIVLKERSPERAKVFVKQFIRDLRQREVAYRDLVIWKTLTKPAEEYEVKAAHVEAARLLREKGWELAVGDKIGYVVVVGSGRLYERVKPYMFASYRDVDVEYYVSKQVVPAAARVLESFGITEEQLLAEVDEKKEKRLLSDFFGT